MFLNVDIFFIILIKIDTRLSLQWIATQSQHPRTERFPLARALSSDMTGTRWKCKGTSHSKLRAHSFIQECNVSHSSLVLHSILRGSYGLFVKRPVMISPRHIQICPFSRASRVFELPRGPQSFVSSQDWHGTSMHQTMHEDLIQALPASIVCRYPEWIQLASRRAGKGWQPKTTPVTRLFHMGQ